MKVYLDDTRLDFLPLGLDQLTEVLEMDLELHMYVHYFESKLTFIGDGFDYINNLKAQYGFCHRITVRIEVEDQEQPNNVTAYFFISDGKFDHTEGTYEVELIDDTYGIFISNAQELKILPKTAYGRDGVTAITPTSASSRNVYTPSTGVNLGTAAKMYRLQDVFSTIVQYLSNNVMSTNLDTFTNSASYYLTTQYHLYNRGTDPNYGISFKEIIKNLHILFGQWFYVSNNVMYGISGEDTYFLSADSDSPVLENIRNLKEEFYGERMFATIKIGDNHYINEQGTTYQLPTMPLVGFSVETFNTGSDCTIKNELDLQTDWVIDHNKIENYLLSAATVNEGYWVLIYADTGTAYKGTYGKQGSYRYYNEPLLNYNVLARHNFPVDLLRPIGSDTDMFQAGFSADQASPSGTLIFNTDSSPFGYDTGGNYSTVTGKYSAPSAGAYKFYFHFEYTIDAIQQDLGLGFSGAGYIQIAVNFIRRTAAAAIIETRTVATILNTVASAEIILKEYTSEFFLDATDTVEVSLTVTNGITGTNTWTLKKLRYDDNANPAGTWFSTLFTFSTGGTVGLGAAQDYRASLLSADSYPIANKSWVYMKENPRKALYLTNAKGSCEAWIKRISRKMKTGESNCAFFTTPNLTKL